MCGLDNWKNMQISRGLLRFTGSSLVFFLFPDFHFTLNVWLTRQHGRRIH